MKRKPRSFGGGPYFKPRDLDICVADWVPPGCVAVLGANRTWAMRLPSGKVVFGKGIDADRFDVNQW